MLTENKTFFFQILETYIKTTPTCKRYFHRAYSTKTPGPSPSCVRACGEGAVRARMAFGVSRSAGISSPIPPCSGSPSSNSFPASCQPPPCTGETTQGLGRSRGPCIGDRGAPLHTHSVVGQEPLSPGTYKWTRKGGRFGLHRTARGGAGGGHQPQICTALQGRGDQHR